VVLARKNNQTDQTSITTPTQKKRQADNLNASSSIFSDGASLSSRYIVRPMVNPTTGGGIFKLSKLPFTLIDFYLVGLYRAYLYFFYSCL